MTAGWAIHVYLILEEELFEGVSLISGGAQVT